MVKVKKDLTGKQFGNLIVVGQGDDYISPGGRHFARWICRCQCAQNNIVLVSTHSLISGNTKSCGCYQRYRTSITHKGENRYDLTKEFGIGYTSANKPFYFDLSDYEIIRQYVWHYDAYGYVVTNTGNVKMHRLIMGVVGNNDVVVDHKNHNPYDNRKENLRICTRQENNFNKNNYGNKNKELLGISFDKYKNKWCAKIGVNYKTINLGRFETIEDAIMARKNAEIKYFGKFALLEESNEL